MDNGRNKNTEKKPGKAIFGVIAAIFLLNLLDGDFEVLGIIFVPLIIFVLVFIIGKVIGKGSKAQKKNPTGNSEVHTVNYKNPDAEAEEKVYAPRPVNSPQQLYYESSDVFDNQQRDKERRIEQLKVFLKNGIIDKEEYHVLLRKYESED